MFATVGGRFKSDSRLDKMKDVHKLLYVFFYVKKIAQIAVLCYNFVTMEKLSNEEKEHGSLVKSFALIFGIFTLIALFLCAEVAYNSQTKNYREFNVKNVQNIGDYLEGLIQKSGEEFIKYQKYYMEHYAEADIPYDFSEYHTALKKYEEIESSSEFTRFDSLSEEARLAYFTYLHEYWILVFEEARKAFNLPYTYYLVPDEENYIMYYMIDGERSHRGPDGKKSDKGEFLYLGDNYYDDPEQYYVQWNTWFTGEKQNDFQIWNNEWGYTYSYYTPVIINGQKLGLIGTEVQVVDVDRSIIEKSFMLAGKICIILLIYIVLVIVYINFRYLKKIRQLGMDMQDYAINKNPEIADRIEASIQGNNEISSLSRQFVLLIRELEQYMISLVATKQFADKMNIMANKDALTGVRNKNSYNSEVTRLEYQISNGNCNFGIVMIDLNYLKLINDNYGHKQGDQALKNLSSLITDTFNHSLVFRVGGDEFVVIIEGDEYKNISLYENNFNAKLVSISNDKKIPEKDKISAALGYATFDPLKDKSVLDVFNRADKNMYLRKKEMKGIRE